MTRQPPVLTPAQRAELTTYRDGMPHKFDARPNNNLIRRDLLRLAPDAGRGFYRITGSGLLALDGDGRVKVCKDIPTDGHFAVFQSEGMHHAIGVSQPDDDMLAIAVADPEGHPFDLGPLGCLKREQVADLRDALTRWLRETRR